MTTPYVCPKCGKQVDVIRGKKVAPHYLQGKVRCSGGGKRIDQEKIK